MIEGSIPVSEFQARRKKLAASLKGAVGVVMAGDGAPPLRGDWDAHCHFTYLTGIRSESGAVLFLDPGSPDKLMREVLLLRPINSEMDMWDGYRDTISADLRESVGFAKVMRTNALPRLMTVAAQRSGRLACLHPMAAYNAPVSPDLELFRKVAERIPGCAIEDASHLIARMRSSKSPAEQRVMRRACRATEQGFDNVLAMLEPGVNERDVHHALVRGFESRGAKRVAYNPIVGSGVRGTVLHYHDNDQPIADGDLVVIDAGAEIEGYASDVTRTFPANGKFSKEQRELYTVVMRSLKAGIAACKPGATMRDVDNAARAVIDKAGLGDTFVHGTGHHLGLETHDIEPYTPLRAGAIITVEPGVYLQDRAIGIRIEDDILVTAKGPKNLTASIPKTIADIEHAMASR